MALASPAHCTHSFVMVKLDNTLIQWTCHICYCSTFWFTWECRYCLLHTCKNCMDKVQTGRCLRD
ncbi:hypothetical protein C7999DRAFT_18368 [Corynascus novoguineensis]|uniref:Uncharacterized protein n=1 Tax=Corynascus novoguineensis TaxID=1126955 RepID=A0AAN7HIC2_9PEZI|nr:hypothetical protein C7999DRAFT_18368 [Corynascus novoguineensis]